MTKHSKTFRLSVLLLFMALAVSQAQNTTNTSSPSKNYLLAYESMSTADWLLKRGMNEDAALLYEESIRLYRKLASEYPTWETNLVNFRINYCIENLARAIKAGDASNENKASLRPPAAVTNASTALSKDETEGSGAIASACELEMKSDFEGALELYRMALAKQPQDALALAGAGRCYLKLGQVDRARDMLFQWSVVPAPDKNVNMLLAIILCHDRQFERALQLAEIAVVDDPASAEAHVILGVALAGAGQLDQAMAAMRKAVSLNPRLADAHYNLARLLVKRDPRQKATAGEHYLNALKFGAQPDPVLAKLLNK